LDVSASQAATMLKGVQWENLYDNASHWFGLNPSDPQAGERLVDTIQATSRILVETKGLSRDPVPAGNPYALQNRAFVEKLFAAGSLDQASDQGQAGPRVFEALSDERWAQLRPVATFKVRPVTFQSGTFNLTPDAKAELGSALEALSHYPNFRVSVRGHTGTMGDKDANQLLSRQRAEAVRAYLLQAYKLDPNRLHAEGLGSARPLPRQDGEAERAYQYRLPRVELQLLADVI
jgi:outer membrane protein OmpA-like peptidoglycan-associated protein